jgi:predicted RNA-binding protein with RPS1 domain
MTEEQEQRGVLPNAENPAPSSAGQERGKTVAPSGEDAAWSSDTDELSSMATAMGTVEEGESEPETMAEVLAGAPEPSPEELAAEGVPPEKLPGRPRVRSILNELQPGSIVRGTVARIERYGAFVDIQGLQARVRGLVHISELSAARVNRVEDVVTVGQEVNARVLSVDPQRFRVALSLKGVPQPWQEVLAAQQETAAASEPAEPEGGERPQQSGFTLADLQRRFGKPAGAPSPEPPRSKDRGAIERQRHQELIRRLRGE